MRTFKNIVESLSAPNIRDLWLDKGVLKYFSANGWKNLSSGGDSSTGSTDSTYTIVLTDELYESLQLQLQITISLNYELLKLKEHIVISYVDTVVYDLYKTYSFGDNTCFSSIHIIDANTNESIKMNIDSTGNAVLEVVINAFKEILTLSIGNSIEVKLLNGKEMQGKSLFFALINYGYGVGKFTPNTGGTLHTITADGVFVLYTIGKDYSITKVKEFDLTKNTLPSGGKEGLVLSVDSSGSPTWKDLSNLEELYAYGVEWDTTVADPACTRIGNSLLHKSLPVLSLYRGCVAKGNLIQYYLDPNDWSKKLDGTPSVLDGTDGTVRVHIPKFYGKSGSNGTKRWVKISLVKIDNTWLEIPEMLLDAYRCTLDRTDPSKIKAVSVMNTTVNFRGGGNRPEYDLYLTTDKYRTDLGKPATNITRSTMRQYANNADSELLCYEFYKWVFYWAFVIEYATFNSQAPVNNNLTAEGYHQGGLGEGLTTMSNNALYNAYYPIGDCGCCNSLGNFSGEKTISIPQTVVDTTTINAQTLKVNKYRGLEIPFGNSWLNLEGIIIKRNTANEPSNVYTTSIAANYGDDDAAKNKMRLAGVETPNIGYIKEFDLRDNGEIIPLLDGGGNTTYKCDYHYDEPIIIAARTLLVGGTNNYKSWAGLGCWDSDLLTIGPHVAASFLTLTRV